METVVLTIHLILALLLIGVVLLQRNEGGALLSGGGNMQARGQATALTKLTWLFAIAFIGTSITLAVLSARNAGGGSVVDGAAPVEAPADAPAAPPPAEAPANAPATAPATGDTAPQPGN